MPARSLKLPRNLNGNIMVAVYGPRMFEEQEEERGRSHLCEELKKSLLLRFH